MSETRALTLTDFLLARIAEDEASARDSLDEDWTFGVTADLDLDAWQWQARRDLAECAAKRRIVDEHTNPHGYGYCPVCYDWKYAEPLDGDCPTLRALASVYADHPDFRDEWRADSP